MQRQVIVPRALTPDDMNSHGDPAVDAPSQDQTAAPIWGSALSCWACHTLIWGIAAAGVVGDLWSKHWAFSQPRGKREIIEGFLSFQQSLNPGALWGMGRGMAPMFVLASIAAMVFVLYAFARSRLDQTMFHTALGLVLGGAQGNLYDRLFEDGKVRDFIKIEWTLFNREVWPWIFNVADILLVVGVSILVLHTLFERPPHRKPASEPLVPDA